MRLLIVALLALASLVGAQTSIVLGNLAETPRTKGWVTVVVPNDQCPPPPVNVEGRSGWLALYGEPWGPRARMVHVRYENLGAFEHAQVDLVHVPGDVQARSPPAATAPAALVAQTVPTLLVRIDHTDQRVDLLPTRVVEDLHRTVLHCAARVPNSMLVAQAWFYVYPGSRSIGFELSLTNSDPSNMAYVQVVDGIALETPRNIFPAFDYHVRRGGGPTLPAGNGLVTNLVGHQIWMGDGQSLAWRGRIVLLAGATSDDLYELLPELRDPVVAMALPKHWAGRWGPWGELPKLHPNENTAARGYGQAGVRELYMRFASKAGLPAVHPSGAIFAEPDWGQFAIPPTSGDHEDFGVTKLAPDLSPVSGGPSHLHDVAMAALYELLRPSYNFNEDATVLVPEDHPNCTFWGLHNHYHVGLSTDRLGKDPSPLAKDPSNGAQFQDWAHMSLNSVYGWCQLTPSHMGKQLLHQVETGWLLGSRVGTNLSEARGWGRTMQAMAWSWCITGDTRTVARLRARWQSSFDDYLQRSHNAVVPFGLYGPDPRKLDVPFWMPWQEHLALTGFDAAFWLCYVANTDDPTGREKAKLVCTTMAKSIVKHGWWLHQGRWTTGDAMWYDEGRALAPEVYNDPTRVWPHWPGTDADRTGSGALLIARRWLVEAGEMELVEKVDTIMTALRSWFEGPSGQERPFTRWSEWAATK